MFKKLINKLGIAGVISVTGLLVAGVAFAAFLITQNVSTGNIVTTTSSALQITNSPFNLNGLVAGGSTSPNSLTIKNVSANAGDVKLNLANVTGAGCADLTITVTQGATTLGTFSPVANAATPIDFGVFPPNLSVQFNQVVSASSTATHLGQPCTWDETTTFSGN